MAEATSAIPVGVYPYLTVQGGKAAVAGAPKAAAEEAAWPPALLPRRLLHPVSRRGKDPRRLLPPRPRP